MRELANSTDPAELRVKAYNMYEEIHPGGMVGGHQDLLLLARCMSSCPRMKQDTMA